MIKASGGKLDLVCNSGTKVKCSQNFSNINENISFFEKLFILLTVKSDLQFSTKSKSKNHRLWVKGTSLKFDYNRCLTTSSCDNLLKNIKNIYLYRFYCTMHTIYYVIWLINWFRIKCSVEIIKMYLLVYPW